MARSPLLIPHPAYRDRYTAAGDAPLDLLALMKPGDMPDPSSVSILWTTGMSSHWTLTGSSLAISATGDTADMSSGTYVATVTMTWDLYAAPNNVAEAELRIICPPYSIYVDPVSGSTSNSGTKASPFKHAPEDVLAAGNELSHTPLGDTLVVHKGGTQLRSNLVKRSGSYILASDCSGWGVGKASYTGAEPLLSPSAPSSDDVFGNPNIANIRKYALSSARTLGQFFVDRFAEGDGLIQWAQWPVSGANKYQDASDCFRNLSGGMYQIPKSCFAFVTGGTSSVTLPAESEAPGVRASFVDRFGSADLTGYIIGYPGSVNFTAFKKIVAHDVANFTISWETDSNDILGDTPAIQICGHPASITAAGQFAWDADAFDAASNVYIWPADGTSVEIMVRKRGMKVDSVSRSITYGLQFDSYYGDSDPSDGVGIGISKNAAWYQEILECDFKWLVCRGSVGGAIRSIGSSASITTGCKIVGNTLTQSVGLGLTRLSNIRNNDIIIERNYTEYTTASNIYAANTYGSTRIRFNRLIGGVGPHANQITLYGHASGVVSNNYVQGARQLTIQGLVGDAGYDIYDNVFITDLQVNGASIYIDGGHRLFRNAWLRHPDATSSAKAINAGVDGLVNYFDSEVFDGISGGVGATITNSIVSRVAKGGTPIQTRPGANNRLIPYQYRGSYAPEWKQAWGTGPHALGYIFGVIAVPQPTNLTNQPVSGVIESEWLGPVAADVLADITLNNCQIRTNTSASDSGATAYTPAPGSGVDLDGKYVQYRLVTGSGYDTDNVADIDYGNGNIYHWTVRTKQAAGYPLINIEPTDFWKFASAAPLGAADSTTLTFAFFANIQSNDTGNLIGQYVSGGITRVNIELLNASPNRFRVTLRDLAGATIAFFTSPGLTSLYNQNAMYLMTVNMSAADVVSGVKIYGNGTDLGAAVPGGTWVQGAAIGWTWSGTASSGFNLADISGKVGMAFLDHGFVDITDADVRDKFNAHRIGWVSGENIMGRQSDNFLCGVTADWEAAGGINLGAGAKFIPQTGTKVSLDSGGAQSWPAFEFADALEGLTGPNGQVGDENEYSVSLNGALANPLEVTLSDGGAGGSFTPSALTFDPSTAATTRAFLYEPAASGTVVLTASAVGITATSQSFAIAPAPATSYTLSGPATVALGSSEVLVVALDGANADGVSIDLALSGVTGLFSSNPLVVEAGTTASEVMFTPSSAGTATITPTSAEGLSDPEPLSIVVTGATDVATRGALRRLGIWT